MARVASRAVQKVGAYHLLEEIGRGGMGTVFKAQDSLTGAVVAIKLVSAEVLADDKLRMRFAQECQVARMLNHPNIVRMLDFGLDGSTPFLVMEYVEGESLGQRLEQRGPLPEAEAVRLIRQVGLALHWAHENKLVHRDVKPDNILVDAAGQAKLADLGLAKSLEGNLGLTRTNTAFGTPQFMAPEQLVDAKRADAQSDLYSLAASLYLVLTGKQPFEAGGCMVKIYKKKLANDIELPNQLVPELSDQLNAAIVRGLRADRKERPASVLEFIESLPEKSATARATASASGAAPRRSGIAPRRPALANQKSPGLAVALPLPRTTPWQGTAPADPAASVAHTAAPQGRKALGALKVFLTFAVSLLPAVLGTVAASRLLDRHQDLVFLAITAGLGLTFLLLWLFIGRHASNR